MKDIPVFTTQHGAAGLILREIPYRQTAYVKLHDTQEPSLLLEECIGFCRACGAQQILATGHALLAQYPLTTTIVEMRCSTEMLDQTDAVLFPVLSENANLWRQISNDHMEDVALAAFLTSEDEKSLAADGSAYFVHKNGHLIGIGKVSENTIEQVVSMEQGAGKDIVLALASTVTEDTLRLTVAAANKRAIRLYERLGFIQTAELSRWYRVL